MFFRFIHIFFYLKGIIAYSKYIFNSEFHFKIHLSPLQNDPNRYAIHFDYQSRFLSSIQPSALIINVNPNSTNFSKLIRFVIYNKFYPKDFCSFQLFNIDFNQHVIKYHNLSCSIPFNIKFNPNLYSKIKLINQTNSSSDNFILFLFVICLSTIISLIILIRTHFYFRFLSEALF